MSNFATRIQTLVTKLIKKLSKLATKNILFRQQFPMLSCYRALYWWRCWWTKVRWPSSIPPPILCRHQHAVTNVRHQHESSSSRQEKCSVKKKVYLDEIKNFFWVEWNGINQFIILLRAEHDSCIFKKYWTCFDLEFTSERIRSWISRSIQTICQC